MGTRPEIRNATLFASVSLAAGLLLPLSVQADSMYVIDRLLVGIHEEPTRESAISKVVPSGTELEILEKSDTLARVRTDDGSEGWVDASYLTDEKPARLLVDELESWKKSRSDELAAAWDEVENLRKLVQTPASPVPANEAAAEPSAAPILDALRAENKGLKETLAAAEQQLATLAMGRPAQQRSQPFSLLRGDFLSRGWHWGVLGVLFLAGMAAGAYVLDYRHRQRHGGFRV